MLELVLAESNDGRKEGFSEIGPCKLVEEVLRCNVGGGRKEGAGAHEDVQ